MLDDLRRQAERSREHAREKVSGWIRRRKAKKEEYDQEQAEDAEYEIRRKAENAARLRVHVEDLGCWFPEDGSP